MITMQGLTSDDRGSMRFSGMIITACVLIAAMVLAPFIYTFTSMAAAEADPLTGFLLSLFVPLMILSVIVSAGIDARGGS